MEFVLPSPPNPTLAIQKSIQVGQPAATYDFIVATGGAVMVLQASIFCSVAGVGFVSAAFQTNSTTPLVILSAGDGAVANWTISKNMVLTFGNVAPFYIPSGGKIQLTVVGAGTAGTAICNFLYVAMSSGAQLV